MSELSRIEDVRALHDAIHTVWDKMHMVIPHNLIVGGEAEQLEGAVAVIHRLTKEKLEDESKNK
jgi:hypothetical protein